MKTITVVLILAFALLSFLPARTLLVNAAENSWATKASMQTSRDTAGVAAVNGIVYVTGGAQRYFASDTSFFYVTINATEAYDPTTDTWTEKASMPTSRAGFGTAVYQNKIYCIGGRVLWKNGLNATKFNEVYDTETDTWQTKTPMPTARYGIQANEVDGKIYLIGGWIQSESSSGHDKSAQVEIYDPLTDSWTTGSPIPTAVAGYASAVTDGKIYVISGIVSGSTITNLTQIYDPKTDGWSLGVPIPMGVNSAAAGATTGTYAAKAIYVIGGCNATYPLDGEYANQVYFPETDSWVAAAPMPIDRAGLAIAVVNDTLYVVGGGHNIFTMDSTVVMQYTPFINPIIETEPFPTTLLIGSVIAVAVVGLGVLFVYFKKRQRDKSP